jgi:hypothetical protein
MSYQELSSQPVAPQQERPQTNNQESMRALKERLAQMKLRQAN